MNQIYHKPPGVKSRWASFENPTGEKGVAAQTNQGMKGRPCAPIEAGQTITILDVEGSGSICRLWMTVSDRTPRMLRSLRLDIYWDGCETPAVSAPLGDFFGMGLGECVPLSNDFFSSPEGRSFNCFIPMPFRAAAKITVTNESDTRLVRLFYDINYLIGVCHADEALYFHAHWRREQPNELGRDFTLLPKVIGSGRFLGVNFGVITDPRYAGLWWGEGEVKMWLDGDLSHPTLCGTGTEDYLGTGWGQGTFVNPTQGCTIANDQDRWAFYRYHSVDPIFFDQDFRATVQVIGGGNKFDVIKLLERGIPALPIGVDDENGKMTPLYGSGIPLDSPAVPEGHCNFLRQDDWSATAYFYLNKPANDLPDLQNVSERISNLIFTTLNISPEVI